jgi:hypothetical protein
MAERTAAQRVPFSFDDYANSTQRKEIANLLANLQELDEMAQAVQGNAEALASIAGLKTKASALFDNIYQDVMARSAVAEQDFARHDYRTAFTSVSLGTEEELPAFVRMAATDWNLFGAVTRLGSQEVLVQITKDLQVSPGVFTIELRTTPTERADDDGWDRRVRALRAVISTIEQSVGRALVAQEVGAYQITIFNPGQVVYRIDGGGSVQGTSKHATVGVPAVEIGTGVTAADRAQFRITIDRWRSTGRPASTASPTRTSSTPPAGTPSPTPWTTTGRPGVS